MTEFLIVYGITVVVSAVLMFISAYIFVEIKGEGFTRGDFIALIAVVLFPFINVILSLILFCEEVSKPTEWLNKPMFNKKKD